MSGPKDFFTGFRHRITTDNPVARLHADLIGKNVEIEGPFGPKPMLYADYVASGRALGVIEDTIRDGMLPFYANSHTEASYCGAFMTGLRRQAREQIARLTDAGDRHAVIFTGSGATAGLNRIVHLLGVDEAAGTGEGATVLIGPYEHHSNILPWRESGAVVVEIPEAAHGGPDLDALDAALQKAKGLVVGSFSAASNVTGIVTDVAAVTRKLKSFGAKVVWDYAGAGPYLPISMQPAPDAGIDAIALSPHKFVGGPAASGVLIVRKDAVSASVPTFPGGGTVSYVSATTHDYVSDIAEREEGGTPNAIGDIRAALAFIVKDVIGRNRIETRNRELAEKALAAFRNVAGLRILGKTDCPRLPIFSFVVEDGQGGWTDPQAVTRFLSDYFGIQARGGCACAGPYGHRLLGIDETASLAIRERVLAGEETAKPGFVRLNLSYLMDDPEAEAVIAAVTELPGLMARFGASYGEPGERLGATA